ncbi:flagellar hook-associated protein FlgL [bacterium]|nr:flagellar hook-associated protein FlgL [bacterium]
MRTSLSQQIQNALIYTNDASQALIEAQRQAVSGKRINSPSDDVPGTSKAMSLRSAISTTEQYADNVSVNQPLLETTDSTLQSLVDIVQSIRDIAVDAAETDMADTESTFISELESSLSQLVDLANTKHADQYIFSGTASDTQTITQAADGTYVYDGNDGIRTTKVQSWVSLQVNIPGSTVFNFDGSAGAGSTDLFTMVTQLEDAIKSGNVTSISDQLDNIDANLNNLLSCEAQVGSWEARIENASSTLEETQDRLETMLSDVEDIDLAEAVVNLKTQENVYQTALSVTSQIMDISLASLNYLS